MKKLYALPVLGILTALSADAVLADPGHHRSPDIVPIVINADVKVFAEQFGSCTFNSKAVKYYPGDEFLYQHVIPM